MFLALRSRPRVVLQLLDLQGTQVAFPQERPQGSAEPPQLYQRRVIAVGSAAVKWAYALRRRHVLHSPAAKPHVGQNY